MPSLRDQFGHFYMPGEQDVAGAMQTGLVVPDTNVLLNFYRFQSTARDELFGALEKLGDRLWVPYQVGLEFHRNRISVIAEQEQYLAKMHFDLEASYDDLRKKVLAFGGRIALGRDRVDELEQEMGRMLGLLDDAVTAAEEANEIHLADRDSDAVLARLEALFEGRVGGAMEPKELEEAKREAKRRADAGIPPGYRDKSKPDPTGDYLVWRQLMTEAKDRGLPVVFVTDDKKEDWYRREHGLTLGARYELREEMTSEAGVQLLTMTTETFLLHARKYLKAEVSDETVDQAKELPSFSHIEGARLLLARDDPDWESNLPGSVAVLELARRIATMNPVERRLALALLSAGIKGTTDDAVRVALENPVIFDTIADIAQASSESLGSLGFSQDEIEAHLEAMTLGLTMSSDRSPTPES